MSPPTSTQTVLTFDGKDGYVDVGAINFDYAQGLTLEAWVRYESYEWWSRVFDFGIGAGQSNYLLANVQGSSTLLLSVRSGSNERRISRNLLETGRWMHLAVVIEPSAASTLYKDGQPVASEATYLPRNVNRTSCYLGKSNWSNNGYFRGQMTEIRLWTRARTAEEIERDRHRRLRGGEEGLAAYWPLDDGAGERARDEARPESPADLHGGVSWGSAEMPLLQPEPAATGLADFGYWWRWKQSLPAAADPDQPFRRGRIWA